MSKAAPMILWCLLPLKVLREMPIVSCPGACVGGVSMIHRFAGSVQLTR